MLSGALISAFCAACSSPGSERDATPLERRWYAERGIELPAPFGVGVNLIGMERDIEVTDVTVTVGPLPPQSISDRAQFAVENQTTLSMFRLDTWALPFLDVYVMFGETRTETSLNAQFEASPPGGGAPVPVEVNQQSKVNGPLYGGGATLVGGFGNWFGMMDANYSRSDLDTFDGEIDAWFLSARVGRQFSDHRLRPRLWTGVAYLDSKRTLTITTDVPILGPLIVEVDQQPANPWTYQLGGSMTLGRDWDLLLELGSNFSDASLAVLSVTYRF